MNPHTCTRTHTTQALLCLLMIAASVTASVLLILRNVDQSDAYHCPGMITVIASLKVAGRDATGTDFGELLQNRFKRSVYFLFLEMPGFDRSHTQINVFDERVLLDEVQKLHADIDGMTLRIVFRIRVVSLDEGERLADLLPSWVSSRRLVETLFANKLVFSRFEQSIFMLI